MAQAGDGRLVDAEEAAVLRDALDGAAHDVALMQVRKAEGVRRPLRLVGAPQPQLDLLLGGRDAVPVVSVTYV